MVDESVARAIAPVLPGLSLMSAALGLLLGPWAAPRTVWSQYRAPAHADGESGNSRPSAWGRRVLYSFALLVLLLSIITVVVYWPQIAANPDRLLYAVWLFVSMVMGMFVQVSVANYNSGRGIISATGGELLLPLLFSIIVYYPVWAIAAAAPKGIFPFYTAFVNGYFWQNVVTAAKPVSAGVRLSQVSEQGQ